MFKEELLCRKENWGEDNIRNPGTSSRTGEQFSELENRLTLTVFNTFYSQKDLVDTISYEAIFMHSGNLSKVNI